MKKAIFFYDATRKIKTTCKLSIFFEDLNFSTSQFKISMAFIVKGQNTQKLLKFSVAFKATDRNDV